MADAASPALEDTTSTEEWVEAVPTTTQFLNQTWSTRTSILKTAHLGLCSYLVSSKTIKEGWFILNLFVIVNTVSLKTVPNCLKKDLLCSCELLHNIPCWTDSNMVFWCFRSRDRSQSSALEQFSFLVLCQWQNISILFWSETVE